MHEASIALSVLEIAVDNCRKAGYNRIESIRLKIGRASGIMIDALLFAFNAVKAGTIAAEASVIIDEIPVSGLCSSCGKDFVTEEKYVLCCPECSSTSFNIKTGRELEIIDMEVF
jgi:hydrogenase nickel incorporation protein HypA/HybF